MAQRKEQLIDQEFAMMVEDRDYIAETLAIETEFTKSDQLVTH